MKFTIALSTLLLCMVTLASTVMFWSSMPTDKLGKVLAGVTAAALEACKYSFFPAGVYYLKKRNFGGAGLLIMGVVLLCISVAATTGFLENAYSQQLQSSQQNSLEYQTKKQQLNSIQQQIDTLNNLVAADAVGSYRTRAYENAKQVKILEDQRDKALAEIKGYRETAQGSAQSLFSTLAIPLGVPADSVRQAAFMCLAVIVDICAIAALLALSGMHQRAEAPTQLKQQQKTPAAPQKQKPAPAPAKQNSAKLTEKEKALLNEIKSGLYGQKLSVREIITNAKTSYSIVKKVLDQLIEENHVIRDGKQYQLVQGLII